MFGVIDNIYGLDENAAMTKEILRNFVSILGCGIGKNYNRNALRWNKIIIMTDADIDGDHITILLLCFLYQFYPDLYNEGIIFKAIPPLYSLNKNQLKKFYKGNAWLFNKKEYYQIMNIIVNQTMDVIVGSVSLSKNEMVQWMEMNDQYLLELNSLVKRTGCQPIILEYVCYFKLVANDEFEFKKLVEKRFPEVEYSLSDHSMYGSYDRENVSLICDALFDKISVKFKKVLNHNVDVEVEVANKRDEIQHYDRLTIGQFLEMVDRRYAIPIEHRYKGLGEADAELLFMTVINPKMRHLIRLRVKDAKKTAEMFELLQSKTAEMREARRKLLKDNPLSYADIDN